jgi:hypothetical protein
MHHVRIDLVRTKSQICMRAAGDKVARGGTLPTVGLKMLMSHWLCSRLAVETCPRGQHRR